MIVPPLESQTLFSAAHRHLTFIGCLLYAFLPSVLLWLCSFWSQALLLLVLLLHTRACFLPCCVVSSFLPSVAAVMSPLFSLRAFPPNPTHTFTCCNLLPTHFYISHAGWQCLFKLYPPPSWGLRLANSTYPSTHSRCPHDRRRAKRVLFLHDVRSMCVRVCVLF